MRKPKETQDNTEQNDEATPSEVTTPLAKKTSEDKSQ